MLFLVTEDVGRGVEIGGQAPKNGFELKFRGGKAIKKPIETDLR